MRYRKTPRVVMAMAYLSALCMAALHMYLSPEEGRAQLSTGIESSTQSPPLHPLALVTPLPHNDLSKLKALARTAIEKSPIQSKTVVGIHHALLNPSVVQQVLTSGPDSPAPKIIIELPNKQSAVILTDRLEPARDSVMWGGHVEGAPGSRVLFIVNAKTNAIRGSIEKGRFIYEIRPAPSDINILEILAIDPSGFPPEHGSLKRQDANLSSPLSKLEDRRSWPLGEFLKLNFSKLKIPDFLKWNFVTSKDSTSLEDSTPVIDVMILYTQAAADQDPNGMGAMACLAVEDLKESFTNSGIQATARLVYHGIAHDFTEAASREINDNLDALRMAGTTPSNNMSLLREQYKADVVSLWVSDATGEDCGMSPTLVATQIPEDKLAFSVVVRRCATSNRSFVHEIGHILQANHDRYQEEAGLKSDLNYGYVKADKGWMTVMSYHRRDCPLQDSLDINGDPIVENGVRQQRPACNRRLHWSNPAVHDPETGDPMGRPEGTSLPPENTSPSDYCNNNEQEPPIDCDGPADNASILKNTVIPVAAFRTGNTQGDVCGLDEVPPQIPTGLNIIN